MYLYMAEFLENSREKMGNLFGNLNGEIQNRNPVMLGIIAILGLLGLYMVYFYTAKLIRNYRRYQKGSPYVIDGMKDARRRFVANQNPSKEGNIHLPRSRNELGGIEFSYSTWMFIDNYNYNIGKWKHVFHKGNESSWPLRAPGVWLNPDKNAIRVYMNSYKEISEYVDVENIPIGKWFNLILVLKDRNMDVYINGNLKRSLKLQGIPKQNYGDLYVNAFGGYSGQISRLRYYDYALNYAEISSILKIGPSMKPCDDSSEKPPYLTANWWTNE